MFCNVANKIEFEVQFKFVDVSVVEMCLQDHYKIGLLPEGENLRHYASFS